MEVLSVTRQRGRVVITLSGEVRRIPAALYLQRPLQPGDEVDLEEYDHWLLLQQYRPALEYAVSLLAQRPYAEQELNQKLARHGYRPAVCEMVLYKLSKHGLLDDRAFAQQWTEARAGHGLGRTRIAQELRRKGVPQAEAEAALEALDPQQQLEEAERLACKQLQRRQTDQDPRKTDQRLLAMLVRKGFSFGDARQAIRAAREKLTEDGEEPTP